jgi:ribosomal protein S18 acetylase RimI-like enzyme
MNNPKEIVLRPARAGDALAVVQILRDTFDSTWRPQVTPAAAARFHRENHPADYFQKQGLEFWIAERDGEVVGFVDWEDDFVNALHIRSAHSRRGVGTRLIDQAEHAIAKAGFGAARLETDTFNDRSRAFYRARGYGETDRYPDMEWDSDLTTLLLEKVLT